LQGNRRQSEAHRVQWAGAAAAAALGVEELRRLQVRDPWGPRSHAV